MAREPYSTPMVAGGVTDPGAGSIGQPAPMLAAAVAMIAGICLDRFLPAGPVAYAAAFGGAFVAAAVALAMRRGRPAVAATLAAIAAVGAMGHHMQYRHVPPDAIVRQTAIEPRLCTLTGLVSRRAHRIPPGPYDFDGNDLWSWQIAVEHAQVGAYEGPATGEVLVRCKGQFAVGPDEQDGNKPQPPGLGERIEVLGTLARFSPPDNPGQWDYADYQRRNGVRAACFVSTPEAVRKTDQQSFAPQYMLQRGIGDAARAPLDALPNYVQGDEGRKLLAALLVGDRAEMAPDVRDAFIRTGTLHFLAISGLHVGMLAGFAWLVCRLCRLSPRPTALVVIVLAALYLIAADFRPSVLRATLVVFVFAAGAVLGRPAGHANSLSVAAAIMLAIRPTDLFDAGFLLCFLVAASVAMVAPRLYQAWFERHFEIERLRVYDPSERWRQLFHGPILRWLAEAVCVSAAAWLAGAALAATTFRIVAWTAPLVSLILLPLVCLALVVGFAYLLVALWLPIAAAPLAVAANGTACLLNEAVKRMSQIPGGQIWTGGPSLVATWLIYALALLWLVAPHPRVRRLFGGRLRAWHPLAAILAVLIVELGLGLLPRHRGRLTVTALNVGHGTAVVLECPDGRTILYDAGSSRYSRVGAAVIEPFLRRRGIRRIDVLALSHPDLDHYSGAAHLLERFPVGCVLVGEHFRELAGDRGPARELLDAIDAAGVPVLAAAAGDRIDGLGPLEVRALGPPARRLVLEKDRSAKNDASLVLSVGFAGRRVLLPGDIEEIGLQRLLDARPPRHDILLTAHHGERSELAAELIDRLRPVAVLTSGRPQHDPPGQAARHFQTDRDGAIQIAITPDTIQIRTFKNGAWRQQ